MHCIVIELPRVCLAPYYAKSFLISLLSSDDKKQKKMFPSVFGNFNKTIGEEGFEKYFK